MYKELCIICREEIDEETGCEELGNGKIVCDECGIDFCGACCRCGKRFLWEDLAYWGNDSICEDCLDDVTSRYNREENDRETQEAYEEMRKRYVGRKVLNPEKVDRVIEYEAGDIGTMYQLTVELDENGVLTELSRLSAELFLNRAEEVIKRRPYPIQNADYETIVDAMLEGYEFEDQPEK